MPWKWKINCYSDDEYIGSRNVTFNDPVEPGDLGEALEDSNYSVTEVNRFDPETQTADVQVEHDYYGY